jgi:tRNA(adenine34) deaminase
MRQALHLAARAYEEGEVPIGALVVSHNFRIIGKGYNQTERLNDPTAHAEMLALTAACDHLGSKILEGCTLFVTVEPCLMCAGALLWARPDRLVFGTAEPKSGYSRIATHPLHPRTEVFSGVMEAECRELMQRFFLEKRK